MERFFGNIGGKLKKFAFVIAIIGIVFSVIGGVAIWIGGEGFFYTGRRYGDGYCFLSGLLVLVVGSLASYMGSWMLYAFGTLVENTQRIADKLTGTSTASVAPTAAPAPKASSFSLESVKGAPTQRTSKPTASTSSDTWLCPKCGTPNLKTNTLCKDCGHSR